MANPNLESLATLTVRQRTEPALRMADVVDTITKEQYHVFEGTTTTVCCLTLRNGFTAVGKSACIHSQDFDAELGRKYAKEEAIKQVFDLEAYMLKQRLFCFGK